MLVATPIGNLGDLSTRALDELRRADVIAAEDTRHTRTLLTHAGIPAAGRLRAVHAHNEATQATAIAELVLSGRRVAYVSDAGTPGISDPGERLVRECVAAGVRVEMVPGPSALLTALVLSGLPTSRFRFEGFLPRKGAARAERLTEIANSDSTVVIFESPHRVAATLSDLRGACGDERLVAVARELTKMFEDVVRGPLGAVATAAANAPEPRGEHVLVIAPAPRDARVADDAALDEAATRVLSVNADMSARDAAAVVAHDLGVPRRRAYEAVLRVRQVRRR